MSSPLIDSLQRTLADRYRFERELGAGGMATVYLAEDVRHRRRVAIKVLHPELSAVIGSERFLKEIELTANLQHPHILPLFDSGDANGQLFYVMPYIEGETLRARLEREQQLPVGDAVRIATEVADALSYAHRRNVIHRDIKPENILLQDGHALVADFGIALAVQTAGGGRLTQTGLSLGTPHYMSPEQAMGERSVDLRADIYALGAVMYEMLAGEPPFTGPTAQAIMARAMTERPRPLGQVRETLPVHVEDAVMTALSKLPADRQTTATLFAEALANPGASGATRATRAMVGVAQARPRASWMTWALVAAGVAAGVFAGTTLRSPASTDAGEPRFWTITLPDSAPAIAGRDIYDDWLRSFDLSQDGRLLVYTSGADTATTLWQLRTDQGVARPLTNTVGAVVPTLSPDARSLAYVSDARLRVMSLLDGSVVPIDGDVTFSANLWWKEPDRLMAATYLTCVTAASPRGGTLELLHKNGCIRASGIGFDAAADGRRVVSNGGTISLVDMKSGRRQRVRRAGSTDTTDARTLLVGVSPFVVGGNVLVFMDDSTLFAAPFDAAAARLRAEPRVVLTGVRREAMNTGGQFAYVANGTFVWAAGGDASISRFVWVEQGGRLRDTLKVPATRVSSFALSADGRRLAYSSNLPGGKSIIRVFDQARGVIDSAVFAKTLDVINWAADDELVARMSGGGGRRLRVHVAGPAMTVDSSGADFQASSRDGRWRCADGRMWPANALADSIRYDNSNGHWCRFSPDGRMVAWDLNGNGFVAPVSPTAGAERRKIATGPLDEMRWSRDGRELVYRAGNKWFAVPSQPLPNGALATPRLVARGQFNQAEASWELAPDGRLLLLQGAPPMRATHLNVITNFPRYVEEKLRSGEK
jgi:serine/threonine-protein kinase